MSGPRNPFRFIRKFGKLAGFAAVGSVTAIGLYVYEKKKNNFSVIASWTPFSEPAGIPMTPKTKWDENWDRRDPKSLVKPKKKKKDEKQEKDTDIEDEVMKQTPTATRHLFLIRHGQYHLDGLTQEDKKLTILGRKQADMTGMRLRDLNYPYTSLVSSTMTRAMETADIIHKHIPSLPMERNDMLREGAPYPPEPSSSTWRPEYYQFHQDGQRIEAAFRHFFHRADPEQKTDSYEVIVCHANVIRYFVCRVLQFPPEGWLRLSLPNASITWVTIRPSGRVSLKSYGDSGFMDVKSVTYT